MIEQDIDSRDAEDMRQAVINAVSPGWVFDRDDKVHWSFVKLLDDYGNFVAEDAARTGCSNAQCAAWGHGETEHCDECGHQFSHVSIGQRHDWCRTVGCEGNARRQHDLNVDALLDAVECARNGCSDCGAAIMEAGLADLDEPSWPQDLADRAEAIGWRVKLHAGPWALEGAEDSSWAGGGDSVGLTLDELEKAVDAGELSLRNQLTPCGYCYNAQCIDWGCGPSCGAKTPYAVRIQRDD